MQIMINVTTRNAVKQSSALQELAVLQQLWSTTLGPDFQAPKFSFRHPIFRMKVATSFAVSVAHLLFWLLMKSCHVSSTYTHICSQQPGQRASRWPTPTYNLQHRRPDNGKSQRAPRSRYGWQHWLVKNLMMSSAGRPRLIYRVVAADNMYHFSSLFLSLPLSFVLPIFHRRRVIFSTGSPSVTRPAGIVQKLLMMSVYISCWVIYLPMKGLPLSVSGVINCEVASGGCPSLLLCVIRN